MIIGKGLIASALKDVNGITYFASGVSNSNETRQSEFDREARLLRKAKSPIVYFSTTPKNNSTYMEHKRRMEDIVRRKKEHTIIRVQYVCGFGGNPANLFNFLKSKIKAKEFIKIFNATRYLLDVQDLSRIVSYLGYGTFTINGIEGVKVIDIAEMIAERYHVGLNYSLIEVNEEQAFNDLIIESIIDELGIVRQGYTRRLICKYC